MARVHVSFFIAAFVIAIGGCNQKQIPRARADPPPVVELSGNFVALADPTVSATQMSFHGVKLGSPESVAVALPHAQLVRQSQYDDIQVDDLNADIDARNGFVYEINIFGPTLQAALKIYNMDQVQMRFGKADEFFISRDDSSRFYFYYSRHLRIHYLPTEKPEPMMDITLIQ